MNLNQVTIPSLDLDQASDFYQKLGLKLIVKALPNYLRFECPLGASTFSVHLVEKLPEGEGIYLYFECEDVDETVGKLMRKGIEIDELPSDKSWLWREARLKDPDQNQIILYYAGKNRKDPPWRIKST
ncbi:VOC family protein [Muriicola sp. Z0-33]|uniref:VOC family protein n=1 Tax=Muriicola sp. Z0-33 TaxID=2816957 RepID=UPI0022390FE1|nr:VOC family protein [Muriicola sp. Z0-33]MCW5516356.1 VOC family protein [Muriicola sp. Z0-33]